MTTPDILTAIHELTEPTIHREPYWVTLVGRTHHHTTTHPPLITQLYDAAQPSSSIGAGITRPAASRPGARIDAIDTANRINHEATTWLQHLNQPTTGDTIDHIRRLTPAALAGHCHNPKPKSGCCIHHDVRRWWTWARIITGWDQPAWQPDNTCPACNTRGTIRIRLVDKLATCTNDTCRATWDRTTIGLLADHIRTENHEDRAS